MFWRSVSLVALLGLASASFGQYTFKSLNNPAGSATQPLGINDLGHIVGYYIDSSTNNYRGFLYSGGTFTPIDDPSATSGTYAQGINNRGHIVGFYIDGTGTHGFLDAGGKFTTLNDPNQPSYSSASAINNRGQIVGIYAPNHAFLYSNGKFTTIDDPARGLTAATGINDCGEITGYVENPTVDAYVETGGNFVTIDDPLASQPNGGTSGDGINNRGQLVGNYVDGAGTTHGFLYSDGNFTTIDYPGATLTAARAINNRGEIVGAYQDASGTHGFIATPAAP